MRCYLLFLFPVLLILGCDAPLATPVLRSAERAPLEDSLLVWSDAMDRHLQQHLDSALLLTDQVRGVLPELENSFARGTAHRLIARTHSAQMEYDDAVLHAETAEELFRQADSITHLANTQRLLGKIHLRRNDHRAARDAYHRAIANFEQDSSRNVHPLIETHLELGTTYFYPGLYEAAAEQYFRAHERAKQTGDQRMMSRTLQYLTYIAYERKEWQEGIDHIHASLRLLHNVPDADWERMHAYYTIGEGFWGLEQVDSTLHYSTLSLEMSRRDDNLHTEFVDLLSLSEAHLHLGEMDRAEELLVEAEALQPTIPVQGNIYREYYHQLCRGKFHLKRGEAATAERHFTNAISQVDTSGYEAFQRNFYEETYRVYKDAGDPDRALMYFEQYNVLLDSLNNRRVNEQLTELTIRYRTQEKELELRAQQREVRRSRWVNRYLGISVVLLLGAAFYFYRSLVLNRRASALLESQNSTLERLNATKSRFFRNITHELRNPLTLVLGPLENALQSTKKPSLRRDLTTAERQGRKMLDLVHEISELNRLDNDSLEVHTRPVDLRSLLAGLVTGFQSAAERKGIAFGFDYRLPREIRPQTDPAKLERIVNNLLSNALKYTDPQGEIHLRAYAPRPDRMRLEVEDTGVGIPLESLPSIFDRFYQVDHPRVKSTGGTGIGLALARELTEKLGGTISVESTEGKGTVFCIDLPLERAAMVVTK